jgi:hypothetical protein
LCEARNPLTVTNDVFDLNDDRMASGPQYLPRLQQAKDREMTASGAQAPIVGDQ